MRNFLKVQNQPHPRSQIHSIYATAALAVLLVMLGSADSLALVLGCSCM